MPLLVCIGLFLPLVFAVADAAKKKFCEAAPLVFLGLSLVLYVLSLFALLPCAVWMLFFLWGGCLIYLGFSLWHRVKKKQLALPSAGVLVFVAGAVVLWWLCRGVRYATWDEFSHWGRAAKALFQQQVLPAVAAGEDQFRDYPPGVALLQALVLRAGRMGFREDVVIYVQGLFSLSLLLYPLREFNGKKAMRAPLTALLLVLAPACVFWNYYLSTMVDGILGVLFGFALVVHFTGEDGTFERVLKCLALAMLPLVKSSGLLFALLAAGIMAVDILRGENKGQKGRAIKTLKTQWRALLLPFAATLAGAGSWSLYLWVNRVERRWAPSGFSLRAFGGLFTGDAPSWQRQTGASYFQSIFTETNYGWPRGFLPYMGFFVVFVGAFLLLRRCLAKEGRRRWDTAFWGLFAVGLFYVLSLLFSYLYFFSEYEAVRLASLSRYLNTYLAAMLVFLVGMLAHVVANAPSLRRWGTALFCGAAAWTVLSNPVVVFTPLLAAPQYAVSSTANLRPFTQAAATIGQYAQNGVARVYVVSQDDLGETTLRLAYEMFPKQLPDHVSSIGPDYAEDDLLSLRVDRQGWASMLEEGYEYVYLFKTDENFMEEFGPLFTDAASISDKTLYKVERTEGAVRLVPVTP